MMPELTTPQKMRVLHFGYQRVLEAFEENETAGSFLPETADGGLAAGVYRMADEIDALRARAEQAEARLADLQRQIDEACATTESCATLDQMAQACVDGARRLAEVEAERDALLIGIREARRLLGGPWADINNAARTLEGMTDEDLGPATRYKAVVEAAKEWRAAKMAYRSDVPGTGIRASDARISLEAKVDALTEGDG